MTRCYQYQLDFVGVASRALEPSEGHQRLVAFQTLLLKALANGWYPLADHQMVRLPDYLRVVRHLGRLLLTRRDADDQRARLCRCLDQPYFIPC